MSTAVLTVLRPITGGRTYRRWAYLILGGALLAPYLLAGSVLLPIALLRVQSGLRNVPYLLLVMLCTVARILFTSLIPAVRSVEAAAVRDLLGGPVAEHGIGRARTWPARWRATGWFVLHILVGGVLGVATLFVPPAAVLGVTMPFVGPIDVGGLRIGAVRGWWQWGVPVGGLLALICLVYVVAGVGEGLARVAPLFLGPSSAERLAAVQQRAHALAERNRLARELHDSVGHALSVVSIQAGAAGRLLATDPDFVRRALSAIEESARSAMADLDHVLGLLSEDADGRDADDGAPSRTPRPTLTELPAPLASTRLTGIEVDLLVAGELTLVPQVVSREAYRIVQEGLTNVLRHAGKVPVALRIVVQPDLVELTMVNPLGSPAPVNRNGRGGRGVPGMRERATVLHGRLTAGIDGGQWRVDVVLPLHAGRGARLDAS